MKQGRQDSNLQPPVLETGALPIELRPSGCGPDCTRDLTGIHQRMSDYTQDPETDEEAPSDDALEEAQEGKGYGEDEGEREESLPE